MTPLRAQAEQVIRECPEVWNQPCHIPQAVFEALVTRIESAFREQRALELEELAGVEPYQHCCSCNGIHGEILRRLNKMRRKK